MKLHEDEGLFQPAERRPFLIQHSNMLVGVGG